MKGNGHNPFVHNIEKWSEMTTAWNIGKFSKYAWLFLVLCIKGNKWVNGYKM